jgi:hypothetical protein
MRDDAVLYGAVVAAQVEYGTGSAEHWVALAVLRDAQGLPWLASMNRTTADVRGLPEVGGV